ncbi:MAG: hypothetical protein EXS14_03720 [Planctomycetes bacterium]|nr:hypothetical protein [Planctomycetota bacterium]
MARVPISGSLVGARFASLLTLLALVAFTVLLSRRAADAPRYRVSAARFAVASMPSWLPGGAAGAGLDRALLAGECSVFDPDLPRLAVEAAAKKPWVREVRSVQRVFPNGVELQVELRTPVALLVLGKERVAVDCEGVVLERDSRVKSDSLALISAVAAAPPAAGQRLAHPQHAGWLEGLALLNALRGVGDHPALESLRVKEVRVGTPGKARKPGDSDIVIVSDKPARIRWGIAPGADPTAERDETRKKLDALRLAMLRYEGLVGVEEVDLSYPGGSDVRELKTR